MLTVSGPRRMKGMESSLHHHLDPLAGIAVGALQQVVVVGGEDQGDGQPGQGAMRGRGLDARRVEPVLEVADQTVQPLAVDVGLRRVNQRVAGGPLARRELLADACGQLGDQVVPVGQPGADRDARADKDADVARNEAAPDIVVQLQGDRRRCRRAGRLNDRFTCRCRPYCLMSR